ncbi:MAG: GNAT family N-acetyltransferase [Algibacter sp.]
MKIQEITNFDLTIQEHVNKFLTQLTNQNKKINCNNIKEIISDNNSHLFFAIHDESKYMGMITVGFYISPTGKKSWIEDVVVVDEYRRNGIGNKLMEFAIQFAKEQKAATLMLTSNPTRIAANLLYQKLDFQQKETNVYLMQFENH